MSFDNDPWATETETKAPVVETVKETAVTAIPTEDPIVLTFKQSGGYDAPWVVLRARTVDEAQALLKSAVADGLFKATAWAAGEFAGTKAGAASPAPQQSYQAPAQPVAPRVDSNGPSETCKHGDMNLKSGVNQATGKAWKGHFCPTPKGTPDQCRPVFF